MFCLNACWFGNSLLVRFFEFHELLWDSLLITFLLLRPQDMCQTGFLSSFCVCHRKFNPYVLYLFTFTLKLIKTLLCKSFEFQGTLWPPNFQRNILLKLNTILGHTCVCACACAFGQNYKCIILHSFDWNFLQFKTKKKHHSK